jgi:hypothetical protein
MIEEGTLSYIPISDGLDVNILDDKIRALVNAGIDCYVDEKRRLVVHPDQWDNAVLAMLQGERRSASLSK